MSEFYLDLERASSGVEVRYACLPTLDADLAAVAGLWGLELGPPGRTKNHTSSKPSDGLRLLNASQAAWKSSTVCYRICSKKWTK